jgi:lipoprotein NlpD
MRGKQAGIVLVALAAATFMGCASSSSTPFFSSSGAISSRAGTTYIVQPGDTFYRIAQRHNVSVGRLMAANGISDPRELRVGQSLIIPGSYESASLGGEASEQGARPYRGQRADRHFEWPVAQGTVSSGFGIRNGAMHSGIDIAAPIGTPIHAADSGTVIFAGQLHGYGNTVIIRHDDDYVTVYGHNRENLVHEGDRVSRGQTIAELGSSGRATGANLHFEVRCDNVARNPLAYLPEPADSTGIAFAGGL